MMILMIVTVLSTSVGGIGGLAVAGLEGFILGASLGLTTGVAVWALISLYLDIIRRERLLRSVAGQTNPRRRRLS